MIDGEDGCAHKNEINPILSSYSFLFLSIPFTSQPWNPFSASPSRLFIEKRTLRTMATHPDELRVTLEVTGSPRRAGSFSLKSFEGLGKPEASLGKLRSRKLSKKTFLPLLFGIFRILNQNIERSFVLCGNWCRTTQFG